MVAIKPSFAFYLLIFLLLEILFRPAVSWSQDHNGDSNPRLTALLDKDSARVGSTVVLTLAYRLPEKAALPADPEIRGLEDLTVVKRDVGRDRVRIKLLVDRLDAWRTGPLSLAYLDGEGKTQTLRAGPVSLTVLSNLGEKPAGAELRPIQGIMPTRQLWLKYLPWAAVLLIILLAGLGVLFWHKKKRALEVSRELQEPPHVQALREFRRLETEGLFEKGAIKEFYFRFSEILKRYLESLKDFPAAEFTTEEIALHLVGEQDRKILPLLRQADLIKFADTIPTPARKDEDLKSAILYIRANSPATETETDRPGRSR